MGGDGIDLGRRDIVRFHFLIQYRKGQILTGRKDIRFSIASEGFKVTMVTGVLLSISTIFEQARMYENYTGNIFLL